MLAFPWLDRAGRLSGLKLATFLAALAPGLWYAAAYGLDRLGAKPLTAFLHAMGDWTVYFLILSLAVTPLRRVADWPKLILVRRMLGLTALAYALIHLVLYAADQKFDLVRVATEIAVRIYLAIGFVALVGLAVLGATSTDAMIRRLGRTWTRLHRLVYGLAVLALVHYVLQSKIDVSKPVFWSGLFLALMGWRLMHHLTVPTTPLSLLGLAAAAGLATAALEAAWYALATGVPAGLVLAANLDLSAGLRPAWWVFGIAALAAPLNLVRGKPDGRRGSAPAWRPSLAALAPLRAGRTEPVSRTGD
ncbi:sulfite oxidase heme-binding subunit YedZ [Methylobacterium isbiliense]|jgi:sulfoxide reductase heme-binding subunit YedZ|uniref:Protein-methionine-sulfoxide reductase heme-binding subunit MsrQ n=1 Tax=Methylobacterium isbiliense TaxID=315478 RepID=A0ABQ4S992_9HYPH|nr:protein-methionine-sulfoxide reductase heme-binding subunit MsrQ [Methylobacterium isbiliense]MDN3623592.1 protein-methionine-sulfoxide reductase heme-binding subunit MsrQ [Methylobacterium isbiliense]GJD99744.1 Protein-methionine-sulfoxide reductase heme-binding subunit MsrQ [Methylobacterium isbiliense]